MADETVSPPEVVHRQVEAYNDGDADRFADWYHEDATVATLDDGTVEAQGQRAIRQQWGELFDAYPELHCELVSEFTVGEYVVCAERVTGMDEPLDAVAVYLVEDERIRRLWLGQ